MKESLLIADDDPDVMSALRYLLQTEGYEVTTAASPNEVLSALKRKNFAVVLLDLNYSKDTTSGQEGLALIAQMNKLDASLAIVAMTAWGSIETAVKAMQAGARDFVQKPWENERLLTIVANQVHLTQAVRQASRLTEENKLLRSEITPGGQVLVSHSAAMQSVVERLEQVAATDACILLTGENGTGKSYLVDFIHAQSQRRDASLIKVNMGGITESLFESEMFGHVKGAFTDARDNRLGRFELAEGGTLFLDEIANTPLSQQMKLLRVLEEKQFEKVGSSRTQVSDCRIICATNSDLDHAVASGAFRKDLLYRINTIEIEVPPLRHRQEDIIPLAEYVLGKMARKYNKKTLQMSAAACAALQSYSWPGNVRELTNALERATLLATDVIEPQCLGLATHPMTSAASAVTSCQHATLEQIEKQVIEQRIQEYPNDNLHVASTLGLSKSAFYRYLKKHNLK
ncbi:MAG: sigma-54 dependent transcriptional regulator [Pseudohongiella sp.]|nr:sigma-54 dependent transcriptional regulator [Pseudohongiella sp.]